MNGKLTLGRYAARESPIHRRDPRAKTLSMFLFMIAVFLIDGYAEAAAVSLFAIVLMVASRISLVNYLKAIRPLLVLVVFVALFQVLFDQSGMKWLEAGPVTVYSGGLASGLISALRMTLFISFTAMLTFTTEPDQLTRAIGGLLRPFGRAAADRLTVMLGIALRFIPTIFEEGERLYKAQVSRGLNLRDKSLAGKARAMLALLAPLTVSVFRRSLRLAESMEARGYRIGAPRTRYRSFRWQPADTAYLILFLLPVALTVWL
jgi:energy-coupling factor transport system permease protein